MLNRTRVTYRTLALLAGPALLVVLGCADSGIGTLYPVSGTVKYKGEPVAKAKINFVAKGGGTSTHGASGEIENGSYSMSTLKSGDGVMPGDYFVTISAREVDEAKLKAAMDAIAAKHNMKGMTQIPPELQAQARKEAKSSLPAKYEKGDTSKLTAKVGEKSETIDFDLTD